MDTLVALQLLGRFRARQGDRVIPRFRTQKAAGVLAYLAYTRRCHVRDALVEIFWPEAEPASARHSLSLALSSLRHQLEPPGIPAGSVIVADRASVELNPEVFTTDVLQFERHLRLAAQAPDDGRRTVHLAQALESYGGSLLPGMYEDWVSEARDRLFQRYLHAVRQQVALLSRSGDRARALELARHAVTTDPLHEELHLTVMRLLAGMGDPELALLQYRELERVLDQELEARPSPEAQRLARQLEEQRSRSAGPAATPLPVAVARACVAHAPLPAGTVTFLLIDIEAPAARQEREGDRFRTAEEQCRTQLRRQFQRHGGHLVREMGDSCVVAFSGAGDALACAVAGQRLLAGQEWPEGLGRLCARTAVHSGDVELEDGDYRGPTLHRAARLLEAAHGGQILCSEAAAALLRRDLETEVHLRELGSYRLGEDETPERLFQVEHAGMPSGGFPAPRAERARRGNLPPQVTRIFGREREMQQLAELLGPEVSGFEVQVSAEATLRPDLNPEPRTLKPRLVTLTGPGGTGKTRLALESAARLQEAYRGAVWFVSLADLTDPRLIADAILAALRETPAAEASPLDQVVEALGGQPTLLILDNVEQLLETTGEAAGTIQALLGAAPELRVLATSRQLVGLAGEREYPVPPLPTPEVGGQPAALSVYESVRLFVDRAQAIRPDFQVTNANAATVAELCARLEGIPLALELAAARAYVVTPAQMLGQLSGGSRFELLATHRRGVSPRQRTLRATIDWSYHLLSPPLQRVFRRLSVFRGGCSLEACEEVCDESLALDCLAQLRECSLVLTEEGPEGFRFRMLETLREYAALQLDEAGEAATLRDCHGHWCLALAEAAEPELRGPEQACWLERLEAEHANLRAALSSERDAETRLRFCAALWFFWSVRGHVTEGRRRLEETLAAVPPGHPVLGRSALRARALAAAGALAHDQSDYR